MAAGLKTHVRAGWMTAILVCAKCSKRLGGGFGKTGKKPLAKTLRQALGLNRFRKGPLGVVEVKCLGVCPRGAVTVVNANDPGNWQLVSAGADAADVITRLGILAQDQASA